MRSFPEMFADAVTREQILRADRVAAKLNVRDALEALNHAATVRPADLPAAAAFAIERLEMAMFHMTNREDR